jgi:hypothetical protein
MLKSLNFSHLQSFDLYDLANISLQIFDQCSVYRAELSVFVNDLRESFLSYERTFQRRVISSVMERKTFLASKRDEAYIAFLHYVEASCHRTSRKYSVLGSELLSVLRKQSWHVQSDGYQRQSTGLFKLIRELDNHYLEMIEQLGASDWFNDLIEAQNEFDSVSEEKKIGAFKEISVRETRPLLEGALRSLFCISDRLYQSAPNEELGKVVYNLNKVVKKLTQKTEYEAYSEAFSGMVS